VLEHAAHIRFKFFLNSSPIFPMNLSIDVPPTLYFLLAPKGPPDHIFKKIEAVFYPEFDLYRS